MRGQTALYRLFSAEDALLYVGISKQFGDRWHQHAREKSWWPEVHHQTIAWYDTYEEADEAETAAILAEHPAYNIAKVPRPHVLDEIGWELVDAQSGVSKVLQELILNRRKAVMRALSAGWTKYKIAATLGVKGPTVDSIIKSAERKRQEDGGS